MISRSGCPSTSSPDGERAAPTTGRDRYGVARPPRHQRSGRRELVGGAERVTIARDEQGRHPDQRKVLGAQPFGPPGRVQRIADSDPPGRGGALRDHHRGDAATHRPTADDHLVGLTTDAVAHLPQVGSERGDQDRHPVGRTPARHVPIREVDSHHRQRGEPFLDGNQRGVVSIRPGAVRQQERPDRHDATSAGARSNRMARARARRSIRSAAVCEAPPRSG